MKRFSVLDRHLSVRTNHVLEASAGTGKTFSIEHLVVRLLIESDPLSLPQILVMTFTRAATRELRVRIRKNIERACEYLDSTSLPVDCPDYIRAILERPLSEVKDTKRHLERALASFDEAQVFTIHSFCARMLRECEESSWINTDRDDPKLSQIELLGVIKDFLRTGIRPEDCTIAQLSRLAGDAGKFEKLQLHLLKTILKGLPIQPVPSAESYFKQIQGCIQSISQRLRPSTETIVADYIALCPRYNKGESKLALIDYHDQIAAFARIFEQPTFTPEHFDLLIRDGLLLCDIFAPENEKKKKLPPMPQLHHPELVDLLRQELLPIVEAARNPKSIFAWVAYECQKHVERYIEQEELCGSNELLQRMTEAVSHNPQFRARVAARYRFAIIDEFQDTDPLQWTILKNLFCQKPAVPMALVGDPKQAIYAFRQADIHTYFEAVNSLPEESHACLDVNYRSCPELIEGLNLLFSEEKSPGLMTGGFRPVQADPKAPSSQLQDGRGAIHFFICEGKLHASSTRWPTVPLEKAAIWPFVANEILSLLSQNYKYSDCAILVRDRYQAQRALDVLREHHIPAILERSGYVTDTPAFDGLMDLLNALLQPRDKALLLRLLGGPIFSLTNAQAQERLEDSSFQAFFYALRDALFAHGIVSCLGLLFSQKLLEDMLCRQDGVEMYRNLQHLGDLLAEAEQRQHVRPDGLLQALLDLKLLAQDEDDCVKIRDDGTQDAVKIMTIHVSKGLEFRIVFAIGLTDRSTVKDQLVLSDRQSRSLTLYDGENEASLKFLKEKDEESIRQAYVAMTRAKDRLYVPVAINIDRKDVAKGSASPMDLLLAHFGQPAASADQIYTRIAAFSAENIATTLQLHAPATLITCERITQPFMVNQRAPIKPKVVLYPPPEVQLPIPELSIHSFSSLLVDHQENQDADSSIGLLPHDFHASERTIFTLPAGRETGVLLHKILQEVPFERCDQEAISVHLRGHRLESWTDVIHSTISNALTAALPLVSGNVPLTDVSPIKQHRELEFIFPIGEANRLGLTLTAQGFLKGFIDLVFLHDDRYYIVDWKSNWLGPDSSFYTQERLSYAMVQGHYHLQARIYAEALRRYLHLVDPRPFEECFGGCIYLFLRGMLPKDGSNGIYCFNPLEVQACLE